MKKFEKVCFLLLTSQDDNANIYFALPVWGARKTAEYSVIMRDRAP